MAGRLPESAGGRPIGHLPFGRIRSGGYGGMRPSGARENDPIAEVTAWLITAWLRRRATGERRSTSSAIQILRGIAILLIFVLNIPWMENTLYHFHADPRPLGWSPADQLY